MIYLGIRLSREEIMKINRAIILYLGLFATLFFGTLPSASAQQGLYCSVHSIIGLSWSPDGERLAVMTLHGVLIYDHNLNLIRTIEAPKVGYEQTMRTGPVWSPDGTWIILPEHSSSETAAQGIEGWVIVNSQADELRRMTPMYFVEELVWSADNQLILALTRESSFGLQNPYSELTIVLGVWDVGMSPITRQYEGLYLKNIRWDSENGITAQSEGLVLAFDNSTLALRDEAPVIRADWWVSNGDGTREAAQQPDTLFVVREVGTAGQWINLSPYMVGDEAIGIGYVAEIVWMSDNERLVGIYGSIPHLREVYPDLSTILQGLVVDARTASLINDFVLQADGDISGYDVSTRGDRIALFRDETWVELWNPLTQERLTTLDIPPLPIADTC
jgi:hypothetical protein